MLVDLHHGDVRDNEVMITTVTYCMAITTALSANEDRNSLLQ